MLSWLWFPVIVATLFVLTAAVSMLLSALFVRYRDVAIIWGVAVSALFYGSPILYPYEFVPEQFRELFAINPLTPLLAEARHAIIDPQAPGAVETVGGWIEMVPSLAISAALCVVAVWYFNREAPRVAEQL